MEECISKKEHELKFNIIDGKLDNLPDTFVYWKTFVWAVSIVSVMLMGIIGMVMSNNAKVQNTEIEMAKIQTKLSSIEAMILELKVILKEHDDK